MNKNFLSDIFDWIGDALERFNPSAFKFLSALLPYLTPLPVAWLTAHSSSEFLNFTPTVSFIFVFALEGIGLWFTSLLVDAIVDWVRSRNWKTFVPVLMFGGAVAAYVYILVSLNVTLEQAVGNQTLQLSRVITLLCFLPLLTGIGNGYYKLKLDYRTQSELSKLHQEDVEFRKLELQKDERLQKFRIKYGTSESGSTTSETTSRSVMKVPKHFRKTSGSSSRTGRPSKHEARVFSYMEKMISETGNAPTFSEVARDLNLPQSIASRLRNSYLETKNE